MCRWWSEIDGRSKFVIDNFACLVIPLTSKVSNTPSIWQGISKVKWKERCLSKFARYSRKAAVSRIPLRGLNDDSLTLHYFSVPGWETTQSPEVHIFYNILYITYFRFWNFSKLPRNIDWNQRGHATETIKCSISSSSPSFEVNYVCMEVSPLRCGGNISTIVSYDEAVEHYSRMTYADYVSVMTGIFFTAPM